MTEELTRIGQGVPHQPKRRRIWWLAAALAALAIGATAVYALAPSTSFEIKGSMVLRDAKGWDKASAGGPICFGRGGYSDIAGGTQVIVTDSGGTTIALGRLGPGLPTSSGCIFEFVVTNVPTGHDFYGVEVGHRGRLTYDKDHIRQPIEQSLGG